METHRKPWPIAAILFASVFAFLVSDSRAQESATGAPAASAENRSNGDAKSKQVIEPAPQVRRFSFLNPVEMRVRRVLPTENPPTIYFGRRADETVIKSVVKVRYRQSPSLIPGQSHVKVVFNSQIIGILPVTSAGASRMVIHEVVVDPQLILESNKLVLELVANSANQCSDPGRENLWIELQSGSELELNTRLAMMPNDLGFLPRPFFDPIDLDRLHLPFAFADRPSMQTLRAAGITASWFGQMASYRRARFPVSFDTIPRDHVVVFATNSERPQFLTGMDKFTGPGLTMLTNPIDGKSKMLLVSGRDGQDLRMAALALVTGTSAFSGPHIDIGQVAEEVPRRAYDAPNWVRMDRVMTFREFVRTPQQLQAIGHVPDPIIFNVRTPPDLFTWHSAGVPIDMKFRYSPSDEDSRSSLTIDINSKQAQSLALRPDGNRQEVKHLVLPLVDSSLTAGNPDPVPAALFLGGRNEVQYAFWFGHIGISPCRSIPSSNHRAMIDPDSEIDFTNYSHYAEMPHLGYFASVGFPFTKYPDLSQTTVVLPQVPTIPDVEAMLALLGRMGESTGHPATRVTLAGPEDTAALVDRDLLLIGAAPQQALLTTWSNYLPAIIAGQGRGIRQIPGALHPIYSFFGFDNSLIPDQKEAKHLRGYGPLGAILALESPITPLRSVVVLTGANTSDMVNVLDLLEDENISRSLRGSVVLMYNGKAESIFAGKTYTIGALPFWTSIWYPLSKHPILLAIGVVFVNVVFSSVLWRVLQNVARRRLSDVDTSSH